MRTILAGAGALAFWATSAAAADLPANYEPAAAPAISGCTLWVPTIWGGRECQGVVQFGGGSPNTPGPHGPTTVTVHTPDPPDPPDHCGPKGEGKHGGPHGDRGSRRK